MRLVYSYFFYMSKMKNWNNKMIRKSRCKHDTTNDSRFHILYHVIVWYNHRTTKRKSNYVLYF